MYRAFGLLRPDSDFSLDEAKTRLAAKFPGFTVASENNQIVVSQGEWWIAAALVSGPEIKDETEGLVGHLAGVEPSEADALAGSDRRVEVWTDVPDPFMEHFDHYLLVVETLKSFNGLLAVDPKEPGLL
ncbi:MAG: hypothetical protein J0I06_11035 [Planctomycetes bacterium]|nr:hypothetical protein [Planctomycetota bacterium]